MSICIDDMRIPPDKERFLAEATEEVNQIQDQYQEGLITDGERYNKVIDIWAQATEHDHPAAARRHREGYVYVDAEGNETHVPSFNNIFMMADSGARGSAQQMRQLAGYARPNGQALRRDHRNADHIELP